MWKGRLLSMAGRICLIKSVLNALSLFYFSLFNAPKQVPLGQSTLSSYGVGVLRGEKSHGLPKTKFFFLLSWVVWE